MRKTLYLKILLGYLIFAFFGFLVVSTFVANTTLEHLKRERADALYKEATLIAGTYAYDLYNSDTSLDISVDGRVRYTVPKKITEARDTKVYFRVADVYRDKRIVVRDGDRVLINRKKQKLAPGEMESVTLTKDMLMTAKSLAFSIE